MKTLLSYLLGIGFLFLSAATSGFGQSQNLTQTIRGRIVDQDTRLPLIGATVVVVESDPLMGNTTDLNGDFRLTGVPVGRTSLIVSYIGYESKLIPDLVVNSGKEVVLNLEMTESTESLDEFVVTAMEDKGEALNEMSLVSSRSITMEEMNRLATGFNDPALIAVNYAGVTNSGTGGNDIIVRGNSPKYLQWRLEGMPIKNPNHFTDQVALNGSTSMLNSNLLATSDFHTGAFNPEFGDALSGVYDIRLRTGNNEKHEKILGIGLLGTDLTVEGPMGLGQGASYLANYRYSTASALNQLGLIDVKGDPAFQDAAFNLRIPTQKAGVFTLHGLGGYSQFSIKDVKPEDANTPGNTEMKEDVIQDFDKTSYMGTIGLSHGYSLNSRGYLETKLSFTKDGSEDDIREKLENGESSNPFYSKLERNTYRAKVSYHHKLDAANKIQVGSIYTLSDVQNEQFSTVEGENSYQIGFDGQIGSLRSYLSWRHQFSEKLVLVSGLHHTQVFFNQKSALEPRLAASYKMNPKTSLNLAFGMHSTMESINHYFVELQNENGQFERPNTDLGLLKAKHYVLGLNHFFKSDLVAKVELYYQALSNLPVAKDSSYISTVNDDVAVEYVALANGGKGQNYGIELTLQKFFSRDYYFLFNTSIYESNYTALDGVKRNTRFNGNYVLNLIGGKEYTGWGKKRNQTLGLNAKVLVSGGRKIIPLLKDENGNAFVNPSTDDYYDYSEAYENGIEDIYQITLSASYKWQKLKSTHELLINLENVTNHQGKLSEYYDSSKPNGVGYTTQFGLLPNLMYKIYF